PECESVECLLQAASLDAADQAIRRDFVVVEAELAGIDASVAELFELAVHREPGTLLGDEKAHALVAGLGVRVGLDQKSKAIPVQAVSDPGLAAVDHVLIAG